jgi:hypothetical protein
MTTHKCVIDIAENKDKHFKYAEKGFVEFTCEVCQHVTVINLLTNVSVNWKTIKEAK